MGAKRTFCQYCGAYNEDWFESCSSCGRYLTPSKDKNRLLWIVLLIFIGLPLLTMFLAFILYILVMGFG